MFHFLKHRRAKQKDKILKSLEPWDELTITRISEQSGLREGRVRT